MDEYDVYEEDNDLSGSFTYRKEIQIETTYVLIEIKTVSMFCICPATFDYDMSKKLMTIIATDK